MNIFERLAKIRGDWINVTLTKEGPVVEGIIHGVLASKSNSRNVAVIQRPGQKPRRIPIIEKAASKFFKRFDATAKSAGFGQWGKRAPIDFRFAISADVYQENLRRDLDIELLCDALQRFGVIKNDRSIWEKHSLRHLDRENPRVKFRLYPFDEKADGTLFQRGGSNE